jgi:hypothetical protein
MRTLSEQALPASIISEVASADLAQESFSGTKSGPTIS